MDEGSRNRFKRRETMQTTVKYTTLKKELDEKGVTLVAVSKTKPVEQILELYHKGQRIFGENKVQEMVKKYELLPKDIQWHLIGHLQTNKVKYIAPFVSLIQSVDSFKLLQEINKQAHKNNRVIPVLLEIYIAEEETKFGLSIKECRELLQKKEFGMLKNISIAGLMGIATNTEDNERIRKEFFSLKKFFDEVFPNGKTAEGKLPVLSMGMSGDYEIAVEEGSTMVRIGSLIFGKRTY